MVAAIVRGEVLRTKRQRRPHFGLQGEVEPRRHDAHHLRRRAVNADGAADNAWVSAKCPLPNRIAEQNDVVPTRLSFFVKERSSHVRLNAQGGEETGGNVRSGYALGRSAHAQVEDVASHRRDIREAAAVLDEVVKFGRRDVVAVVGNSDARETHPDDHEAARIPVRQRTEEHAIHHAEDRCVRADAERERQHRNGGEAGVLRQHPYSVPQILEKCRHCLPPSFGLPGQQKVKV